MKMWSISNTVGVLITGTLNGLIKCIFNTNILVVLSYYNIIQKDI